LLFKTLLITALSIADPLFRKFAFRGNEFDYKAVNSLLAIFDLVLTTERGDCALWPLLEVSEEKGLRTDSGRIY
jgi:hypothetical protein